MKYTLLIFCSALLVTSTACTPPIQGVESVEYRTFGSSVIVKDDKIAENVSETLMDLAANTDAISEVPDFNYEDRPYIRVAQKDDVAAGTHKVQNLILVFGPSNRSTLLFKNQAEAAWNTASPTISAVNDALNKLRETLGIRLRDFFSMEPDGYNAVVRAGESLSSVLGVFPEDLAFISVEAVTWPNTALGFEEEGKFYAMMLVPGHRVLFRTPDSRIVEAHTSEQSVVVDPSLRK